jgi:hypothetical protein
MEREKDQLNMTGVNQEAAIIPVKVSPVMILNHHCGMVFSILSIHHHKEYTLFHSGFSLQAEILTYPGLTHNDPGFQMNRNHFGPWSIFSNLKKTLCAHGNWTATAKLGCSREANYNPRLVFF